MASRTKLRAPSAPTRKSQAMECTPSAPRTWATTPRASCSKPVNSLLKRSPTPGRACAWARMTSSTVYWGIHWACSEYSGFLPGAQYSAFSMRASSQPARRVTNSTLDG